MGTCCRCASPARYAVFYDTAVGVFAAGSEPQFCEAHNDEVRLMSDAQRAEVFRGFPLSSSQSIASALGQAPRPRQIRERI